MVFWTRPMVDTEPRRMEYDCELRDGACQTGHQEIEGVSMGYLRVEGRKMFALAQVFSALFRDIPRTTIMKRMEVLNIRSRRCDIKELRTLKAMQSVPGRAVKCSLIAKEDLDALCLACQALSPKKRRKRRKCRKSEPALALSPDVICSNVCKNTISTSRALTKESAASATGAAAAAAAAVTAAAGLTINRVAQQAQLLERRHSSKPAQHSSKTKSCRNSLLPGVVSPQSRNYEKVAKAANCYSLTGVTGLLPAGIVNSFHTKSLHSAIAVNECNQTSLPLYLKSKKSSYSGAVSCGFSNGYVKKHNSPPQPVNNRNLNFAQRKGKPGAAGSRKRGRCAQGTSTGYSSDSGSSVDFEKDSDFGSSYQSTSSESSDEDDNLDGRSAQSSSSEEGSSSETDSSSACSGDSVQSTRYRQAALPTPTSRFPSHGARGSAPEDIPALSTASDVYKSSPPAPAPFLEIKIKTEPFSPDTKLLFPQELDPVWASYNSGSPVRSPSFGCLGVATVKNEPSSAGPVSGEGSEREAERAAALRGHSARQGASAICPDGSRQFLQQKSPSLHPEGGFEAAPPLLKNGNYLHKGAPDNGHSLGLSNQAQSQPEDLSQESALAGSPLRSCEAPAVAPGLGCTEPERINIDSGPQGDTREPRTEKFERLIRTSKLWCYAKGFNFDSKNGGFASAAAYSAGPRASKSKPAKSHLAHSGGSGGCLLKRCSSPRPRGRPALSSKALKVNGLERNLKGTRAPRGSDAERLQRCSKETSNRDSNGNIGRKGSAAGGAVTPSCKRKASGSSLPQTPVKRSFSLLENFPCPPSLVVGKDGDLSPAYSLCSQKCLPHKLAHPPCRMWQLGGSILPVPPSHRFRGYNLDGND